MINKFTIKQVIEWLRNLSLSLFTLSLYLIIIISLIYIIIISLNNSIIYQDKYLNQSIYLNQEELRIYENNVSR